MVLLAAMLSLASCRDSETGAVTVTVIGTSLPRLADPVTKALSPAELLLVSAAGQGLVRFDPSGNIAPGLAERWAVSDDGLSYVFRLQKAEWSDGRRVRARDVVRLLQRQIDRADRNPMRDTIGAIRQVVAMTDRVVAVELSAARPHLLQLLAQPEFGLVREGQGTGPFRVAREEEALRLTRTLPGFDGDEDRQEEVRLAARPAEQAVAAFTAGATELVLGGTVSDLAVALGARLPRNSLRIDPVAGLFGLVPARKEGPAADLETRALLDEAIDRQALVAALGVPELQPRATLLQPGLDGVTTPFQPAWASAAVPAAERQAALLERARALFSLDAEDGETPPPVIRVALPSGPGGAIILRRLQTDWQPLGVTVEAASPRQPVDFRWVDAVAPSSSPAWFLRSFRCEFVPVCSEDADRLLDAARLTGFAPQRTAFFADAERIMRVEVLFIPVAAPVRWSLVAGGIDGFDENRFAIHPLTALRTPRQSRN